MHEISRTCTKYIPSFIKNIFFNLSKYKVEKWSVNGKLGSIVIGPAFRDKAG
jgi:hypothetical protein